MYTIIYNNEPVFISNSPNAIKVFLSTKYNKNVSIDIIKSTKNLTLEMGDL